MGEIHIHPNYKIIGDVLLPLPLSGKKNFSRKLVGRERDKDWRWRGEREEEEEEVTANGPYSVGADSIYSSHIVFSVFSVWLSSF